MVDAKRKLDKLLIEWKPKNFNTRDAKGIDLASKVRLLPCFQS